MIERLISRIDDNRFDRQLDSAVFWGGVGMFLAALGGTFAGLV